MMKYVVFPQLLQDGKKGEALKMAFEEYDQKQVEQAIEMVLDMIEKEAAAFEGDTTKIILGGFS